MLGTHSGSAMPAMLLAVFAVLVTLQTAVAHEHGVISLTDDSFEHATQAASGQTTGYWFVYFGKEDDASDQRYWATFADQQEETQPWLLHAHVNIDKNPKLAERFSITNTPSFILFRNRKMHRFGGAPQEIDLDTIEDLEAFTAGGWGKVAMENVPKDEFSLHIPKSTVAVIVVVAAIVAVVFAYSAEKYGQYLERTRPVSAPRVQDASKTR